MNFIKKLKINLRLNLFFNTLLVLIFALIGIFLYLTEKNNIIKKTELLMENEIKELSSIVRSQNAKETKMIKTALQTSYYIYQQSGKIRVTPDEQIKIEETNIYTMETNELEIPKWMLNDEQIYRNPILFENMQVLTNTYISFLQKSKNGYLFISSSIPEIGNNMQVLFIPNSSELVNTIERGESFAGKLELLNKKYRIAARPIYIDAKVQGMLCVATEEDFSQEVIDFFNSKQYYQTGYPFVIDKDGFVIIHPTLTGNNIKRNSLFKKIKLAKLTDQIVHIKYKWPENRYGEWKYQHVAYLPDLNYFIGTAYFEKDLLAVTRRLGYNILIAVIISSLSVIIFITFIVQSLVKRINKINETTIKLSAGILPNHLPANYQDEIGSLKNNINTLILNLKKLQTFSNELKNNNLQSDYTASSETDEISNNLIELKNYLLKEQKLEKERKKIDKRRTWRNEGLTKFINILRAEDMDLKKISYEIIKSAVKYLDAIQGGFFIVNDINPDDEFLELISCYAYNQEKIVSRKIHLKSGLIGRAVIEKSTLHLTEIPDDYILITSALGESKPKSLIITPLLYKNNVLGIIEIASINLIEKYKIDFIEEIGNNIASTISSIKISEKTDELLQQSRKQSAIMQKQKDELHENIKELEDLRDESENRTMEMQSIFKAVETTALLVEFDTYGKIISMNDRFLNTIQQRRGQIIGKYHKDITSMKTTSPDYIKFWDDLLSGKSKKFTESLQVKDQTVWLTQNYTPILDNNNKVYKILNIAIDISENKLLEKQLRMQVKEINKEARMIRKDQRKIKKEKQEMLLQKTKFNTFIDNIDSAYIRIEYSLKGRLLMVNSLFCRALKFSIDEILGEAITNFVIVDNLDELLPTKRIKKIIKFKTKRNKTIQYRATLFPIKEGKDDEKILLIGSF